MEAPMVKFFIVLAAAALVLTGCGTKKEIEELNADKAKLRQEISSLKAGAEKAGALKFLAGKMQGIKARIVTNLGNIELAFMPGLAPVHCFNFITRAECGFYDNSQFHRVIKGFMIQGGDPNSRDKDPYNDGQGGPLVNIPHEFNSTHHGPGVLSMARVGDITQGAGCQFFIMHGDNPGLNNQYTAFGKVTAGMDVVNKIAETEINKTDPRLRDRPVKPVVIKKIEVYR
jgi:peptidyl-prolyl cis-trans isomerase B (cyclophilin B)